VKAHKHTPYNTTHTILPVFLAVSRIAGLCGINSDMSAVRTWMGTRDAQSQVFTALVLEPTEKKTTTVGMLRNATRY
jgi:hypothetical protein